MDQPRCEAGPRANASRVVVKAKHARLQAGEPHVAPLVELADRIAIARGLPAGRAEVPYPDPDGGGIHARALFLLSDPGPATDLDHARGNGSGLLSIDNDDPTAQRLWLAYKDAGLERRRCLHWNAVPFPITGKQPSAAEKNEAALWTIELLTTLPHLRVVVLMGRVAEDSWHRVTAQTTTPDVRVLNTVHPSNRGMNGGLGKTANTKRLAAVVTEVAAVPRQESGSVFLDESCAC
ncbi:uracil-DNA glycosylase [Saccharomonospora cyanea]|uniref:Uracil DNA glycosylase superfamily protein n=1 Tax=Saccharomonospora cyanea NA-134 TaxID=882082 RepID=H5XG05_9PSEU|nr:uracil-DNA glycosylase [Saccharomonospora cyanea]EHR61561.1 uracil DNA glycosylase superfamily protein [Saccharomonospora cyanea NA-134]